MKPKPNPRRERLFQAWVERYGARYSTERRSFVEFCAAAERGEIAGLEPVTEPDFSGDR